MNGAGLISQVESLKALRNKMSREIPTLQGTARQEAITQMQQVAAESRALEGPLREVEAAFDALMLRVPNVPADDVPEGLTDGDNVEIKTWGEIPQFDFPLRDHVELGEYLDIIDIPRGSNWPVTHVFPENAGALLEQAVLQFAHHMVRKGFTPMVVPHLVKDEAMVGTAYFPAGQEQTYRLPEDQVNLIGTAEVPVTAYHADEILHADELPKYYVGLSSCYRREAGPTAKTHGASTVFTSFRKSNRSCCASTIQRSRPGNTNTSCKMPRRSCRPCTCPIVWSWCVEAIWGSRK